MKITSEQKETRSFKKAVARGMKASGLGYGTVETIMIDVLEELLDSANTDEELAAVSKEMERRVLIESGTYDN